MEREYAQAGVDYKKIEPFKKAMQEVGKRTLKFPNRRKVYIKEEAIGTHGAVFEYRGRHWFFLASKASLVSNPRRPRQQKLDCRVDVSIRWYW